MAFCGSEEDRDKQGDAAKAQSDKPCDDASEHCPKKCKPIDGIHIRSLEIKSDHGLLKDHDSNWNDGGARFAKPEWTPAKSNPVSHTMDLPVEVELTFEVTPPDACPETGDIVGTGPGKLRFEKTAFTFSAGKHSVVLKSTEKLEKKIQALAFDIDWATHNVSASFSPGKTSTTMYVTMSTPQTPRSPGVTLKRMRHAVDATGGAGSLDPHVIVKHVISKWNEFNLSVAFNNEWELADDKTFPPGHRKAGQLVGADCQTIVRHCESVIKMVGCPGKAEAIVVWAKVPTPAKAEENAFPRPNVTDPEQRHNSFRKPDPRRNDWIAGLVDGSGGLNRYEACLRFTYPEGGPGPGATKYYPGGVTSVMSNANQVIRVFTNMSWCDISVDPAVARQIIFTY